MNPDALSPSHPQRPEDDAGTAPHSRSGDAACLDLDRRRLLGLLGGTAAAAALPRTSLATPRRGAPVELDNPLYWSSATDFAEAIRDGRISSLEVVDACLARIEAVNPEINAVFQLQHEAARDRAHEADAAVARGESWGPLHGVPMTIKDSLDTGGVISTGGTQGRADFVPERDATVVRRAKEAGAILLGKSNTPEFTAYFETFNLVYGRTNNPWDLERTSGGSSGGAAAIVAAGGAPFDIGSDFGGSIRLPAHYCGVVGLKPTMGRVPRTGHIVSFGGVQDIFQQLGPLARTVDDAELIYRIIAGPDLVDPAVVPMPMPSSREVELSSLRVAVHVDNGVATPTPETRQLVRDAADALADAGARVEKKVPPAQEELFEIGQELWGHEGSASTRRELERWGTTEHTLGDLDSTGISADELSLLMERWYDVRSRMLRFMQGHDVILCPSNAEPAAPHGTVTGVDTEPLFSYTEAFNITGWPAIVVPAGLSPEGLPIDVQLAAAPAHEARILAAAREVEAALGGFRRPPI